MVVTLAFIALLSTLVLFYFAQTMSYHTLSNSGFNDFKSGTLGQSALQVVVGDLLQEIANGSTATNFASGTTNESTLYTPTTNAYILPMQSNPSLSSVIPNLIRYSVRSDPVAAPGVGSRASAVSSTNASLNGQYVSLQRWNKHYLIPSSTTNGIEPLSAFIPPDWVFLTSSGPVVLTTPSTNVIGRYAYAIYNEGGLLDVNVAGFPSQTATNSLHPTSSNPDNLQNWGYANKGSIAFADLTTLGLTQAQIDTMIGWRNNASAQVSGSFDGGYSFTPTSALSYHDFTVANTNGFLSTSGQTWTSGGQAGTDQAFTSRQSLIAFATAAGFPMGSLQYLATFTRDTEQPTFVPAVGRPQVQNSTNSNLSPFGTGNDAYGVDRSGTPSTDINPPLLSVRVTSQFTRADNTVANPGDPLIKERFPLSRLSLLTSSATATQSQSNLIYKYFGLSRSSPNSPWIYNHGSTTAGIFRLGQVAALNPGREPDFFELLKAAINVGSLGKGSASYNGTTTNLWTTPGTEGYVQQAHDTLSTLQLLQIGANIIDQAKNDNFPTRIQLEYDTTVPPLEVRGIEDLPYLYRFRNWITQSNKTNGAFMIQPELWNPHAPGSYAYLTNTGTPSNFRVRVGPDPTLTTNMQPISLTMYYASSNTFPIPIPATNSPFNNYGITPYNTNSPNPAPLNFSAGELNGFWGFREPTILSETSVPATAKTSNATNSDVDVNTGANMTGILVANFPWNSAWVPTTTLPSASSTDTPYKILIQPGGNAGCLHFYLEYQNSSGSWITYEDVPFEYEPSGAATLDLHTVASSINKTYPLALANLDWDGAVLTDPRTSRWGMFYSEYLAASTSASGYVLMIDANNNEVGTEWPSGGISLGSHLGARADAGFTNGFTQYPKAGEGFQHGYWTENSVLPTYQTDTGDNGLRYIHDPDGVVRRVMGGYATDPTQGGPGPLAIQPSTGLPMATGSTTTPAYGSRPTILHRPFRSVAELGYAFRDSPWGNINFSFPESGDSALLDVFCINDTSSTGGVVAGHVDLNTRQAPVLAALFSGSLLDKDNTANPVLTTNMASALATQLVTRTSSTNNVNGYGPLTSRADLVGTWTNGITSPTAAASALKNSANPRAYYSGFSGDIGTVTNVYGTATALITRQREAPIRALADVGTTRTWNLLIDLIAQSGRFPANAKSLSNFAVEGEKHYWLHISIDRYTGKILGSQLEVVKE